MARQQHTDERSGAHEQTLRQLGDRVRGALITPEDARYDDARSIWNDMIDRHPAAILRCSDPADVIAAVNTARESGVPLAVMGAGHNVAGKALCDDGLVIDLSPMRSVEVYAENQLARAQAGATLADFDAATQEFGMATTLGVNSTTGIAGLTLGGGFGWLSRLHGLTIDNLLAVDVVTAAGEKVRASEREHADLFWALRGGGGNFGVVTAFEYRLHAVGPEVLAGPLVFPGSQAGEVVRFVRDFHKSAPDEVSAWPFLRKAPPLPFLPEDVHGSDVVILPVFFAGSPSAGEEAIAPLREFGSPIADAVGPVQYAQWQQAFDPLLTPGMRNYWKAHNMVSLPDAAIDTAVDFAGRLPGPHCEMVFIRLGGAVNRVAPDATAYPHRDAEWIWDLHMRWEDASEDREMIEWARGFAEEMAPYSTGGAYVNLISEDSGEETRAYGRNYARLAELKARYDPENLFRINQNVAPAAEAA